MDTTRPVCPCHGFGACVHRIGGGLDLNAPDPVGGIDWERGWQWHCPAEPCDNYSVVTICLKEWLADGSR
jgi:hypothetical protein